MYCILCHLHFFHYHNLSLIECIVYIIMALNISCNLPKFISIEQKYLLMAKFLYWMELFKFLLLFFICTKLLPGFHYIAKQVSLYFLLWDTLCNNNIFQSYKKLMFAMYKQTLCHNVFCLGNPKLQPQISYAKYIETVCNLKFLFLFLC